MPEPRKIDVDTVLAAIARRETPPRAIGPRLIDLANEFGSSKATVHAHVRRLRERGLVESADPSRRTGVVLTPSGRALVTGRR